MLPLHASLSLWTWQWDPTVLLGTLALAGGYLWLIHGRGRVDAWSPLARLYFASGLMVLFLALESPIDVGGDNGAGVSLKADSLAPAFVLIATVAFVFVASVFVAFVFVVSGLMVTRLPGTSRR